MEFLDGIFSGFRWTLYRMLDGFVVRSLSCKFMRTKNILNIWLKHVPIILSRKQMSNIL